MRFCCIHECCTLAWSKGLTVSSLMPISGVLPRDLLPFRDPTLLDTAEEAASAGTPSGATVTDSSSSSPSSLRSAQYLPA